VLPIPAVRDYGEQCCLHQTVTGQKRTVNTGLQIDHNLAQSFQK
jgi:hypothetical protein